MARNWIGWICGGLAALYTLDHLLKLAAVVHFFRRPAPRPQEPAPAVTLLQPITRGASNLAESLRCRAGLSYPGPVQHVLICDAPDLQSQAICRDWMRAHPALPATLMTVTPRKGTVATKIEKLQAGLALAGGEVFCFIDDDVAPRPQTLRVLVSYLDLPAAGAVFGLACYTDWSNMWSSLMSAFVNSNALLSYIPLSYLAQPFTITGHLFALRRSVFVAAGGLDGLDATRIDDDHELARRVRRLGLRCVQTPAIYDVDNRLDTARAYANQMKRWFVIPRQTMVPFLTMREQLICLFGSVGNLILPLLALLALLTRRAAAWRALAGVSGLFAGVYFALEVLYLKRQTPARRWLLVFLAALIAPVQALVALASGDDFDWRGRRARLRRGGEFLVDEDV